MEAKEKDARPRIAVIGFDDRRSPRFDVHLPIEYFQIKLSFAHTGNISESGLLAYFPKELDVNQYLRLKLFFPLGPELNIIKVLAETVWMDLHLSKNQKYYPYGVKFVEVPPEDGTKLRHFLGSLSSPIDNMLSLINTPKVEFWIRKITENYSRGYTPRKRAREILSLVTKFDANRRSKEPTR